MSSKSIVTDISCTHCPDAFILRVQKTHCIFHKLCFPVFFGATIIGVLQTPVFKIMQNWKTFQNRCCEKVLVIRDQCLDVIWAPW